MQFNEGFIGYHKQYAYEKFSGSDSKEQYEINLKIQPNDWYYRKANISYERNDFGHRCKNLTDISLDNYILFTGCSHTEGIGLELQKTYAYQISKQLNCDYYNLAVGGTGVDVMIHNLSLWLTQIEYRPKCIVVQWPSLVRFIAKGETEELRTIGPWVIGEDESKFMHHADNLDYFRTKKKIANSLINQISKRIKVIHISMDDEISDFGEEYIRCKRLDFARDLSHYGIESQTKLVNDVLLRL